MSENNEGSAPEYEVLHTKLHFVDLAGSERLKRTGATGDRAKEGISINSGLVSSSYACMCIVYLYHNSYCSLHWEMWSVHWETRVRKSVIFPIGTQSWLDYYKIHLGAIGTVVVLIHCMYVIISFVICSRTLMVACISPSDRDFMESLSTLKYANRARNIQNKAVINQDRTSQQLSALRLIL